MSDVELRVFEEFVADQIALVEPELLLCLREPHRLASQVARLNFAAPPVAGVVSLSDARQRKALDTGRDTETIASTDAKAVGFDNE